MARGRKRLSVGPSSANTAWIFRSSPSSSWLCSALATADFEQLLPVLGHRARGEGQDGHGLVDVLAADVVADQPRLASGGAHVLRVGLDDRAVDDRAPVLVAGDLAVRLAGRGLLRSGLPGARQPGPSRRLGVSAAGFGGGRRLVRACGARACPPPAPRWACRTAPRSGLVRRRSAPGLPRLRPRAWEPAGLGRLVDGVARRPRRAGSRSASWAAGAMTGVSALGVLCSDAASSAGATASSGSTGSLASPRRLGTSAHRRFPVSAWPR